MINTATGVGGTTTTPAGLRRRAHRAGPAARPRQDGVAGHLRPRRPDHHLHLRRHQQLGTSPSTGPSPSPTTRPPSPARPARRPGAGRRSLTCTATYTITQADLDAGRSPTTPRRHAFYAGSRASNEDTATVTADKNPALSIDKSVTPRTYANVGRQLTYTYVVTNTGNVTMTVRSPSPTTGPPTCPAIPPLAPGHPHLHRHLHRHPGRPDAGAVVNTATASAGTTTSPPDSAAALTAHGPAAQPRQDGVAGHLRPRRPDHHLHLRGHQRLGSQPQRAAHRHRRQDHRHLPGRLPASRPGADLTCTATYTITQADLDAGTVTNHATAQPSSAAARHSNEDTADRHRGAEPGAEHRQVRHPGTYDQPGDGLTYSYVVTNTGQRDHDRSRDGHRRPRHDVTCPATGWPRAQSVTCTATYTVTQADMDAGPWSTPPPAPAGTTTARPTAPR